MNLVLEVLLSEHMCKIEVKGVDMICSSRLKFRWKVWGPIAAAQVAVIGASVSPRE